MSIAQAAVSKRTVTGFTTTVLLAAGLFSYFQLGQLEDPEFTVKSATVVTSYPGASAEEVELEVTDRIEIALQEMAQLDYVESLSRPGMSIVQLEIKPTYKSDQLPQIWDEVRKKVGDIQGQLPPSAGTPQVGGRLWRRLRFSISSDTGLGFHGCRTRILCRSVEEGIELGRGRRPRRVVGRANTMRLHRRLGNAAIPIGCVGRAGWGHPAAAKRRRRLWCPRPVYRTPANRTGRYFSFAPKRSANWPFAGPLSAVVRSTPKRPKKSFELAILAPSVEGTLSRRQTSSATIGKPAIALAIANVPGANIVDLGRAIDQRLHELMEELPVGIEPHRVSWQSDLVDESIRAFMISLLEAVAIVLLVLWIAMGMSTAIVVGLCGLVFVILGSFLVMALWGIDLQRMSLGALIIAMGMMVDNAIVVADGILVRIQQGMDRTKAAIEAATLPSLPLLGATLIAVMAFYPIYASPESAGEYCASLFQVVAVSLLLSWLLSVTITPLMCIWMLPNPKVSKDGESDPYDTPMYRAFRSLLGFAIRRRWAVVLGVVALLAVSLVGFTGIDRTFFPESARLQVMVDYWARQGTRIERVSEDIRRIEEKLLEDDRVTAVSSFIGQGPPRFYLPVEPEKQYSCYAQLIVNVADFAGAQFANSGYGSLVRREYP